MKIELLRATADDADEIQTMQVKAFRELLEKYQDYDTNPGNEPVEGVRKRLEQDCTYYYFICAQGQKIGAVRIVAQAGKRKRISPIFVLPEYWDRGIAQRAIRLCEEIHGDDNWELETILQEPKNCYLYEKMGYRQTGRTEALNDKLTLAYYTK